MTVNCGFEDSTYSLSRGYTTRETVALIVIVFAIEICS